MKYGYTQKTTAVFNVCPCTIIKISHQGDLMRIRRITDGITKQDVTAKDSTTALDEATAMEVQFIKEHLEKLPHCVISPAAMRVYNKWQA